MIENTPRPELSPQDQLILGVEQAHHEYLLTKRKWYGSAVPYEDVISARIARAGAVVDLLSATRAGEISGVEVALFKNETRVAVIMPPTDLGNRTEPKRIAVEVKDLIQAREDARDLLPPSVL